MSVNDTYSYISNIKIEAVLRDKPLYSELVTKRVIKPVIKGFLNELPIWFYTGVRGDYVLVSRVYCSCKDYIINIMSRKSKKSCKHLIIQKLAEETNEYRVVEVEDLDTLYKIVREILEIGISPTLRGLLHRSKVV
ncbi:MAG: hypothetical protein ABWW65_07380 [Thermoprotei archaeon]